MPAPFSSPSEKESLPTKYESIYNIQEPVESIHAFRVGEAVSDESPSSKISDDFSFVGRDRVLMPTVPFITQFEYYTTVGKVQSVVDAYAAEVRTRGWEFESDDDGIIEKAEEWAKKFNLNDLIEYMTRDLLICGNTIIGVTDWKPVQMDRMVGLRRDDYGKIIDYIHAVNPGAWVPLEKPTSTYVHCKFIDINRKPWGIGLFHALTTIFKWNNHDSVPELELYRRHLQNAGVVEEKYAFPRVMYSVDTQVPISTAEMEKLKEQMKGWKPGDRLFIDKPVTMNVETIDGAKSGLLDKTTEIQNEEITSGLQSSVNRLRTQPSAMADASESNTKDDAMLLYIFSKLEEIINSKFLPLIFGDDSDIEFHFGQQDDMELTVQEITSIATLQVNGKSVVAPIEVRKWLSQLGLTLDDGEYESFLQEAEKDKLAQQQHTMDQIAAKQGTASPNDQKIDSQDVTDLQKEAYRKIIKAADKALKS